METSAIVKGRIEVKRDFIKELEGKIRKEFLRDWAMGWMLDIAIDTVIARETPEEKMFTEVFIAWREKCLELASLVTKVDEETHLYGGIDLTKISPEICQRWRTRFANLSEELAIN
jgi:hypothetical protein